MASHRQESKQDHSEPREGTDRRVRADAQRNLDALLHAAKAVFADSGVDVPVREIAEQAGVGIGTVYRHFPQRSDLIAAVFRREMDECADAAPILAAEHEPFEALANWMQRYGTLVATKRGLATALHSGNPLSRACPRTSSSDSGPHFGCSLTLQPSPARSAPISIRMIFWWRSQICACRPTKADPAMRSA